MVKTRYLLLLLAIFVGTVARGQDFNPDSPEEPSSRYRLSVKAVPAEAATVSGGGMYLVNTRVSVKATAKETKWKFVNWTDSEGNQVSTNANFTYTTSNAPETLTANFEEVRTSTLTINYDPETLHANTVTTYKVGSTVNLSVSTYGNYTFDKWTDSEGNSLSTNRSFTYTVTENDETLTAHYKFTPGSPAEPNESKPKHKVYLEANPAAAYSFSKSTGFTVTEGSSFNVTAYNNGGYVFSNWTIGGDVVGTSSTYNGTMGSSDITLVANYTFSPAGPSEPSEDTKDRNTLYAVTTTMYKGETSLLPIYLENTKNIKSLSFTLSLPDGITASTQDIQTTLRTSAYTVDAVQNGGKLNVSLSGGTEISERNGVIVRIPVTADLSVEDSLYDLTFDSIAAIGLDGDSVAMTKRDGRLSISTLEEGELQAQFSVDRYMNRAQFTNQSTENARSFLWEFGDGTTSTEKNPMHIYANEGSYTVRLTAKGIIKSSVAEQTIIINPSSTWQASGDYTLDDTMSGARNFTSLHEAIDLLSQCTPSGEIVISVARGKNFAVSLEHEDSLAFISTLSGKLQNAGDSITFVGTGEPDNVLSFNANTVSADLQTVLGFIANLKTSKVIIELNGALINIPEINRYTSQTLCSGTTTEAVPFTAISGSDNVSVRWTASVMADCKVTGYQASGTGDLPAMDLSTTNSKTDCVSYQVNVMLDGVMMHTYIYNVYVKPLLSGHTFTLSSPADSAVVDFGLCTLRWNSPSAAVTGYKVTVSRTLGENTITQTYNTTSTSYRIDATPGASYEWSVTACGDCDNITSEIRTFTVREQADLTVLSVNAPTEATAGNTITVTAVVGNIGKSNTQNTSWYDALYYSTSPDDLSDATLVSRKSHYGALEKDSDYTVSWDMVCPESSLGTIYFHVVTDDNGYETESDETNNVGHSEALGIILKYVSEADYQSLKNFYNATNGGAWKRGWRINSNAITPVAWPGVTFDDDGNVTAISLPDNNIVGELPLEGIDLPYLASLNLSKNPLRGDLAKFCKQFVRIGDLNMSYCRFKELSDTLPQTITSLNLGYQCVDLVLEDIAVLQQWTMGDAEANIQLGTLIGYNHEARDFSLHPRLQLTKRSDDATVGYLEYRSGSYRYVLNGDYKLEQGTKFIVRPTEGPAAYTRMRATLDWKQGDANIDASVDVLDAQHTLNYILGRNSGSFNFIAADTYASGYINVQDVVATINMFITEDVPSAAKHFVTTQTDEADDTAANILDIRDGSLWIDATDNIAAIDVTINGAKASELKLQLSSLRYQMVTHDIDNGVRVVLISPNGYSIQGNTRLLKVPSGCVVAAAMAANEEAEAVGVAISTSTTGIGNIDADDDDAPLYDLGGRKLAGSQPNGIYIREGKKIINRQRR